jgi:hypothetical protein
MDKPSKYPKAADVVVTTSRAAETDSDFLNEPLMTHEDLVLLLSLDPMVAGDATARRDLIALLSDEKTATALRKYESFFKSGGVDVRPAIEAAPEVHRLVALRDHLERSVSVVNKHLAKVGTPAVDTVYKIRRAVNGTVENSPVRLAFADFEAKWRKIYERKAAPSAAATKDTKAEPKTEPKSDPASDEHK